VKACAASSTSPHSKYWRIFAGNGFEGVATFIEGAVPEVEREKAAETYLKILDSAAFQTLQLTREQAGLAPAPSNENSARFVRHALSALSDSFAYGSPIYLQLASYDEVKASGLQLTRSPGKNLVYLGSVAHAANALLAAPIVFSISAGPCAAETNPASKADGAR